MNDNRPPNRPLVDLTTLNGIESVFRSKTPDPWAYQLAGTFADFVVLADVARYALPLKDSSQSEKDVKLPSLLQGFIAADKGLFVAERLLIDECGEFNAEFLPASVKPFQNWINANSSDLKKWIALHNEDWIRAPHGQRLPRRYAIPDQALRSQKELENVAQQLSLPIEEIWYALDVILRYPTYGNLAGQSPYLNHPIRDVFLLPTMNKGPVPALGAISFRECVASFVPELSQAEYITLILRLRELVREKSLHILPQGQFDLETIREIARKAGIPATLRQSARWLSVVTGSIGTVAVVPAVGVEATIVGGLITVATALWPRNIPRSISKVSWLKWAFEWQHLEGQTLRKG